MTSVPPYFPWTCVRADAAPSRPSASAIPARSASPSRIRLAAEPSANTVVPTSLERCLPGGYCRPDTRSVASVIDRAVAAREDRSVQVCPACGRENPDGFLHCGYCGSSLAAPVAERRKLATLVF